MEVKVLCDCGQKYKFDVEPVGGRMPVTVACPGCGADGTASANSFLAQFQPAPSPLVPPLATVSSPAPAGLRTAAARVTVPPPLPAAPRPIAPIAPPAKANAAAKEFSWGLGILGAVLGALVGGALVYGFYLMVGFRFPLSGIAIGAFTGYGARWLGRGTHTTLGIIAGTLALISIVTAFYFIYGEFFLFGIISIVISVGIAYRVASE